MIVRLAIFLAVLVGLPVASSVGLADDVQKWEFRVLLDDKEVGFHRYELRTNDNQRVVTSQAEFDVKFLFITAYRYRHALTAEWQGACLESLQAETDADGRQRLVSGKRSGDAFMVEKTIGTDVKSDEKLNSCVMNFAYWEPSILEQDKLLNPQTGEYLDVEIEPLDDATIKVSGEQRDAKAYRFTAKDMRIDVWYSTDDDQWLALESLVKGGRVIRYELV